jgi:hypothetical protein
VRRILPLLVVLAQVTVAAQLIIISPPVLLPPPPAEPGGGDPGDFESRLIDWEPGVNVGVPGGIPTSRTQCVTSACDDVTNAASGYKDGTDDARALIQAAVSSAPANTYVLVPAGTWKILGGVEFSSGDSNVTLRGAGVDTTIFDCRAAASTCFSAGTQETWNYPGTDNEVTAFTPSGDNTVLTVTDATAISGAGSVVLVVIENDTTLPVLSVFGYNLSNGAFIRKQITKVVSKTGTSVTVFPPIYGSADLTGLDAKIYTTQLGSGGYGFEDFTVDANISGSGNVGVGIGFFSSKNSWVQNVKSIRQLNYSVKFEDCVNVEVRRSTLGQLAGGGSNGGGLLMNNVSGALIEDNIITQAFPGTEMNHGSVGNVIAYNFVHNTNGAQGINVNHGPFNMYNLVEGNVTTNTMSDGYFGGEGYTTYHRNLIHGNGINCADAGSICVGGRGTEADSYSWVIAMKRLSRNASVVGNVLGTDIHSFGVYSLGQPNIGNSYTGGTAQYSVGSYWADWNASGPTIIATLTTRTSDCVGVMTLTAGSMASWASGAGPALTISDLRSNDGLDTGYARVAFGAQTGSTVAITSCQGGVLPALSTSMRVMPGANGMQEEDLDVAGTLIKMQNWEGDTETVLGDLDGYTMVDSLFRSAKPSWFNSLDWPPVDPNAPVWDYEIIPAGYRYMNAGSDPP